MTSLLPQPRTLAAGPGTVTLRAPLTLHAEEVFDETVETFANDVALSVGWPVLKGSRDTAAIVVVRDEGLGDEAYRLVVDDHVTITVSTPQALSYAFTVLRQLGPASLFATSPTNLEEWTLPTVEIDDSPRFAWRGVHLDVSRHFFEVQDVTRFIDLASQHRLNRVHLHLNDDQGWRVEIPSWPRLTSVGAWRAGSPIGHEDDGRQDDVPHGGFYTRDDIVTLVAHARRRHVQLVPEIDLPGHAQAVLAAYPQFANSDEPLEVWTHWGISSHVLNVETSTLDFCEEVVTYVAALFGAAAVHIGGDECPSDEWAHSASARAVMEREGLTSPGQLQGLFTQRLAAALRTQGREVLAWDEVLDASVPPGTVILAWRSADKGVEAARRGYDVVMAPMQRTYFDWLSSDHDDEPVAVAPRPYVTTWRDVYGFKVVPEELEPSLVSHIRGAQAQLWTEYIATRDRLDYMAFPRLCAFAEVVWGSAGDEASFHERLRIHLARLDAQAVAYRPLEGGA